LAPSSKGWRRKTSCERTIPPHLNSRAREIRIALNGAIKRLSTVARIQTSSGKFVGWTHLPNSARSFYQSVLRKFFGHIPRQPWIPFAARKAIERCISAESLVWEVGAGFSTLWFADRVRKITSIEASQEWYDRLSRIIERERIRNVDLRFEWEAERMADFSELGDAALDLLFIDGGPRGQCLQRGFSKVKPGGYVYLDNWDTEEFWGEAIEFPKNNAALISEVTSFVDYVPAQVGVYEGLLIKKA
jgi:hypothetical protein